MLSIECCFILLLIYKIQVMISILSTFAKNVRKRRQTLNITQEKLAELSSLHRTYIGSIERCEKNITLINAYKIAKALGTDLSELLKK